MTTNNLISITKLASSLLITDISCQNILNFSKIKKLISCSSTFVYLKTLGLRNILLKYKKEVTYKTFEVKITYKKTN